MTSASPRRYLRTDSSTSSPKRWLPERSIRFRLIRAATASSTSSGVSRNVPIADSSASGVTGRLKESGNDRRAVRLEEPGALVQRAPGLLRPAQAGGFSRRHSTYIESAALDAAIRSGISRSAPHTRHHCKMSASLGACLADSIRLVFASCQPAAADSDRAVRPASRRMSRSRPASCCLARWTLDDGEMATTAVLCRRFARLRWTGTRRAGSSVPRRPRRPPSTSGPLPCLRPVRPPGCDRRRKSTRTG